MRSNVKYSHIVLFNTTHLKYFDAYPMVLTPSCVIAQPSTTDQTLTVEQILNKFQAELDRDTSAFLADAHRVAQYDALLRDSQRNVSNLSTQVQKLLLRQAELDRTLNGIGSYQSELSSTLEGIERHVDELFASQSHLVPEDADVEREKAYANAIDIDGRLAGMNDALRSILGSLDAAQERAFATGAGGDGADDDVGQILATMNANHDILAHLEAAARRIEGDVGAVGMALSQGGQGM